MKKLIFSIALLTASSGIFAQSSIIKAITPQEPPQERIWVLKLTGDQIDLLGQIIDKSTAPHTSVRDMNLILMSQIQAQQKEFLVAQAKADSNKTKKEEPKK